MSTTHFEGLDWPQAPLFDSPGHAWMELLGDLDAPMKELLYSKGIVLDEQRMQADIQRLFKEVYLPCVRPPASS